MAFQDLKGGGNIGIWKIRDNSTNKSLATLVARRATAVIRRFSSLTATRRPTTASSQVEINSKLAQVVEEMNQAIDNDPPEGNTYDLVGHVQTSAALMRINNQIDVIGAQLEQLQEPETASFQVEQVTSPISALYGLEIERASDGDTLDQASAFEIYGEVAVEGSEGARQLAQAVIGRFNLYPDVSRKSRLLDLMDILVVKCDNTFYRHLAEEGFFQTLISDEKVQSDQHFRNDARAHLATWLGSLSGKAFEIAINALRLLSDSSKGDFPTDLQAGVSTPRQPSDTPKDAEAISGFDTIAESAAKDYKRLIERLLMPIEELNKVVQLSDQLLDRGLGDGITFQTPRPEQRLCKFLLSSYVQAGDIVRASRRLKWFSFQAIHIARQAFHLIIRFNDFIGTDEPTEEQYNEGMELDDALEELEDKIGALSTLDLDEAIQSEEVHKYDLARLYQIFFSTRAFYPNGRDHTTDPVLKRLADSDHAALILARPLHARSPHAEDVQILDAHDGCEDNGNNHGHISDVSASQAERDDTETGPAGSTPPQTSAARIRINKWIDIFVESPTATTPPVAAIALPAAKRSQWSRYQPQGSIPPPPRRRESQPPATPENAEAISELDPIAGSVAKDNKRFIRHLIKPIEELNKMVQPAARDFGLAHNIQGGTIRMPDSSHDQAVHQAVRELIESGNSAALRQFQETSMKMNQIITKIRDQMNLPMTCKVQLYQLDDPEGRNWACVLPDDVKTTNELISHLVEGNLFKDEGGVRIFLRKGHAHRLTPKGRLWELTDGSFNLRFPGTALDNVEYEEGALVLDWVVNDKNFVIVLVDNGKEEMGHVLELPRPNKKTNKSVREYLQTHFAEALPGYEIDRISDLERPHDNTVADKPFHHINFQPTKHRLVVKLRTRI